MTRDSGSIVVGWLTKVGASLAVLGLLTFDGIALATTNFSAADHANTAANDAADTYKSSHNVQLAYNTASTDAAKNNETVDAKTFIVQQPDGHITLTLHKQASTLWMHRVDFLKKYGEVTATGHGSSAE